MARDRTEDVARSVRGVLGEFDAGEPPDVVPVPGHNWLLTVTGSGSDEDVIRGHAFAITSEVSVRSASHAGDGYDRGRNFASGPVVQSGLFSPAPAPTRTRPPGADDATKPLP